VPLQPKNKKTVAFYNVHVVCSNVLVIKYNVHVVYY